MSIIKTCTFSPNASDHRLLRTLTPAQIPALFSGRSIVQKEYQDTFLLIRRTYRDGSEDFRLLAQIDLEDYSFHVGTGHPIRAAECFSAIEEETPVETLPLLFLDDCEKLIIESIARHIREYDLVFSVKRDSVLVEGFALPPHAARLVEEKIDALSDPAVFKEKYATDSDAPLVLAVGRDGNLSSAKREWEKLKISHHDRLSQHESERFVTVEIQNIYSPHVSFAPIHRLYQGEDTAALMDFFPHAAPSVFLQDHGQDITLFCPEGAHTFRVNTHFPLVSMTAGILSRFVAAHGGRVVPIRGKSMLRALSAAEGQVGILLPPPTKQTFFPGIIQDGILPSDSFIIEEHE